MNRQPLSSLQNAASVENDATVLRGLLDYDSGLDNEHRTPSPKKQLGKHTILQSVEEDARMVLNALEAKESPMPLPGEEHSLAWLESPDSGIYSLSGSPFASPPRFPTEDRGQQTMQQEGAGQRLANVLRGSLQQQDVQLKSLTDTINGLQMDLAAKNQEIFALKDEKDALHLELKEVKSVAADARAAVNSTMAENQKLRIDLQAARRLAKEHEAAANHASIEVEEVRNEAAAEIEAMRQKIIELEAAVLHESNAKAETAETPDAVAKDQDIEPDNNALAQPDNEYSDDEEQPSSPLSDVFAGLAIDGPSPVAVGAMMPRHMMASDDGDSDGTVSEASAAIHHASHAQNTVDTVGDWFESMKDQKSKHVEQVAEVKLLRSELLTMSRKFDAANETAAKASHALHAANHKLQQEKKAIKALQDERCQLQAQLLVAQTAIADRSTIDPGQMEALLHELAGSQRRVEALLQEKAGLMHKIQALQEREAETVTKDKASLDQLQDELKAEQAKSKDLEVQVEELNAQLKSIEAAANEASTTNATLQQMEGQMMELRSQLELQYNELSVREQELNNLREAMSTTSTEAMSLREQLHEKQMQVEQLKQDNAGLSGRLQVLDSTLVRLESKEDDLVSTLARDKAELQGKLQQVEEAASAVQNRLEMSLSETAAQQQYARQLEEKSEQLQAELQSRQLRIEELEYAGAAAAQHMQSLSESHAELELNLHSTVNQLATAQKQLEVLHAEKLDVLGALDWNQAKQGDLELVLRGTEESREELAQELDELLLAFHSSEIACENQATAIQLLEQEKKDLYQEIASLQGQIKLQDNSMEALRAECDMLRKLGSDVEDTNKELVDNMCDMNGLIDAVSALQRRTSILQEELSAAHARLGEVQAARDGASLESSALASELQKQNSHCRELETTVDDLHRACIEAEGMLASSAKNLDALNSELQSVKEERDRLQARCITAEALSAVHQHSEAVAQSLKSELTGILAEKEGWLETNAALRNELDALKKAHVLAEGKLVLAKQKESTYQEMTQQLHSFHGDIVAAVEESEDLRRSRDVLEERCAELVSKCFELGERKCEAEDLARAADQALQNKQQELDQVKKEASEAHLTVARLEEQVKALSVMKEQLAVMEEHRQESTLWMQEAALELASKAEEAVELRLRLEAAEKQLGEKVERVLTTTEQLEVAEAGAADAVRLIGDYESSLTAANKELASLRKKVKSLEKELETAHKNGTELAILHEKHSELVATFAETEQQLQDHISLSTRLQLESAAIDADLSTAKNSAAVAMQESKHIQTQLAAVEEQYSAAMALVQKLNSHLEAEQQRTCQLSDQVQDLRDALATLQVERDALHSQSASNGRAAELLQSQCDVLREQIEFIQNQRAEMDDEDATTGAMLQELLRSSQKEQERLRESLTLAAAELAESKDGQNALLRQLDEALAVSSCHQEERRVAESRIEEMNATLIDSQLKERTQKQRIQDLEQSLNVADSIKDQACRDVENLQHELRSLRMTAAESSTTCDTLREKLGAVENNCHSVLDSIMQSMQQQCSILSSIEAAIESTARDDAVLEGLAEVAHTMMQQLQQNTFVSNFKAPESMYSQVDVLSSKHSELVEQLKQCSAAAHQVIETRYSVEAQTSAQLQQELENLQTTWKQEKRAMKSVCKLALAVVMERVASADYDDASDISAAQVANDLEAIVHDIKPVMIDLGLDRVWNSLKQLAFSHKTVKEASAVAEEVAIRNTVLDARCTTLEADVYEMRMLVDRWQGKTAALEQVIHKSINLLDTTASSIKWVIGDFTCTEPGNASPFELESAVQNLDTLVKRLIRRQKTLTGTVSLLQTEMGQPQYGVARPISNKSRVLSDVLNKKAQSISDKLQLNLTPVGKGRPQPVQVDEVVDSYCEDSTSSDENDGGSFNRSGVETMESRSMFPTSPLKQVFAEVDHDDDVPLRVRYQR